MGCFYSLYEYKHCKSTVFNMHIPQLSSDMGNHHDLDKERTLVTVEIRGCSALWSRGVGDEMGNTYGHQICNLCNMMVTRNSQDT